MALLINTFGERLGYRDGGLLGLDFLEWECYRIKRSNFRTSQRRGSDIFKSLKVRHVILGFIGFVVVLLIIADITTTPEEKAENARKSKGPAVHSKCTDLVTNRLRSPSTATFPGYLMNLDQTRYLGNGRYEMLSYVDAQNPFGAVIRTHFRCLAEYVGGSRDVVVTDLTFLDPDNLSQHSPPPPAPAAPSAPIESISDEEATKVYSTIQMLVEEDMQKNPPIRHSQPSRLPVKGVIAARGSDKLLIYGYVLSPGSRYPGEMLKSNNNLIEILHPNPHAFTKGGQAYESNLCSRGSIDLAQPNVSVFVYDELCKAEN